MPARGDLETRVGAEIDALLVGADEALTAGYPGDRGTRQPVHTVYVPADLFSPALTARWGQRALAMMDDQAPDPEHFAGAMGLPPGLAREVQPLVRAKLTTEPIEDLRLDFEDGYGERDSAVEDADAGAAAAALAAAVAQGTAPPFVGLRCKSLEPRTRRRAIRTLDLFIAAALEHGPLPAGLVLTLPKVTSAAQVAAMAHLCTKLEEAHRLKPGRLVFEVQVETPQAVLGADGTATIARCVHAGQGRVAGLHYGTYDYSAALGIAAGYQSIEHPAADHARAVMQVAAAGTGVRLSDGSTNIVPCGDRGQIAAAWRLHARLVRRSLERGFYQGWDMHPGHLPSRYAATYGFFRQDLPTACARLRSYLGGGRGALIEEPATARALAGYVARGAACGAVTPQEIADLVGPDLASLDRPGLDALRAAVQAVPARGDTAAGDTPGPGPEPPVAPRSPGSARSAAAVRAVPARGGTVPSGDTPDPEGPEPPAAPRSSGSARCAAAVRDDVRSPGRSTDHGGERSDGG